MAPSVYLGESIACEPTLGHRDTGYWLKGIQTQAPETKFKFASRELVASSNLEGKVWTQLCP